ncbi:imm11 family protein, partial [Pseudomonas kitaguniensis]|uniref:imm11 family protein n=1 Tax=Pseudomonas kitaguniensis TaxID=2607908 RepID=UPI003D07A918
MIILLDRGSYGDVDIIDDIIPELIVNDARAPHRHSGERKFYVFGPDITGGGPGHGLVFVNKEKLLTPPRLILRPDGGGFPKLNERPHIAYDKKKGRPPRDLEGTLSGY